MTLSVEISGHWPEMAYSAAQGRLYCRRREGEKDVARFFQHAPSIVWRCAYVGGSEACRERARRFS